MTMANATSPGGTFTPSAAMPSSPPSPDQYSYTPSSTPASPQGTASTPRANEENNSPVYTKVSAYGSATRPYATSTAIPPA
jgi:hypothetical protein